MAILVVTSFISVTERASIKYKHLEFFNVLNEACLGENL